MGISSKYLSSATAAVLEPDDDLESVAAHDEGPLLELKNVSKIFGDGDDAVFALDEVELKVEHGEFVAVIGATRSGKSTCLNILGCLDTPSFGSYRFCGMSVETMPSDQLAALRRRYVGFVFSRPGLLENATALENVEQPLFNRGLSFLERAQHAMLALCHVGLGEFPHVRVKDFSLSQQYKLSIARAIASNPAVLLIDDPTSTLETNLRVELMQLLMRLRTELKLTLVMITQRVDTAAFADRVVRLHDGRVVAEGRRVFAVS